METSRCYPTDHLPPTIRLRKTSFTATIFTAQPPFAARPLRHDVYIWRGAGGKTRATRGYRGTCGGLALAVVIRFPLYPIGEFSHRTGDSKYQSGSLTFGTVVRDSGYVLPTSVVSEFCSGREVQRGCANMFSTTPFPMCTFGR